MCDWCLKKRAVHRINTKERGTPHMVNVCQGCYEKVSTQ